MICCSPTAPVMHIAKPWASLDSPEGQTAGTGLMYVRHAGSIHACACRWTAVCLVSVNGHIQYVCLEKREYEHTCHSLHVRSLPHDSSRSPCLAGSRCSAHTPPAWARMLVLHSRSSAWRDKEARCQEADLTLKFRVHRVVCLSRFAHTHGMMAALPG